MNARQWLRENGYSDVAAMIDEIMAEWQAQGNRQRRNWWAVLAGRKNGSGVVVAGRMFPVLKAAQRRQNLRVRRDAMMRSRGETAPPAKPTGRWPGDADGA
jgi:hypothetical protein